ncbi:uncharacterized protein F4822DRAFT_426456 [Hypoxylon trugodes]|uniref:uncharacterized protein n=1 Tax=Hypoxylon trugodes TaxID=326681 RepID=UPI00218F4966|nr:uncharacterized protein F4822DRAFT_426456 [Hypoxylon trugodes]KAI1390608.1 hypothetical protein F4822DRAFT_426456 [Hypoxylon trugodes]
MGQTLSTPSREEPTGPSLTSESIMASEDVSDLTSTDDDTVTAPEKTFDSTSQKDTADETSNAEAPKVDDDEIDIEAICKFSLEYKRDLEQTSQAIKEHVEFVESKRQQYELEFAKIEKEIAECSVGAVVMLTKLTELEIIHMQTLKNDILHKSNLQAILEDFPSHPGFPVVTLEVLREMEINNATEDDCKELNIILHAQPNPSISTIMGHIRRRFPPPKTKKDLYKERQAKLLAEKKANNEIRKAKREENIMRQKFRAESRKVAKFLKVPPGPEPPFPHRDPPMNTRPWRARKILTQARIIRIRDRYLELFADTWKVYTQDKLEDLRLAVMKAKADRTRVLMMKILGRAKGKGYQWRLHMLRRKSYKTMYWIFNTRLGA